MVKAKTSKRNSSKKRRGTKKGMNKFFTLMLQAKRSNAPQFKYNGKTYKRKIKGKFVCYKKA